MAEYIEREAAKKAFCEYCDWAEAGSEYCQSCPDPVGKIPAADVVPVRHGRWIKTIGENGVTSACRCSMCGFEDNRFSLFRYCPNCGARMDGDANAKT